jgi:hypothetical protein
VAEQQVISPSEPDLATLATEIKREHEQFKLDMISGCQRAINIGKRLLRAKEIVQQDGKWTEWLPANTNIDERQAQRYMLIALNEQKLLAKGDLKGLTMTGAIKLIEQAKNPEDREPSARNGKGPRKKPVDNGIEKNPLGILKQAWDKCNRGQQDEFRQHIAE